MLKYLFPAVALISASSSAFAAVNVNTSPLSLAAPANTSVLVDFDSPLPTGFALAGGIVQNVSNSHGAEPAGDTSNYLSANSGDPATLSSTLGFRAVSLYWGSIDTYNTITLLGQFGQAIASYTGLQIYSPANGDQSSGATNRRVTFTTSGATSPIYGLGFASGQPAFEVDNVAFSSPVGGVPEPTTWAMMIGGLGLVGAGLRTRKGQSLGLMPVS